jgi:hypothetical protein
MMLGNNEEEMNIMKPLTDIERIYFNNDISQAEKVMRMAEYLHKRGDIHQQLYFAIKELYKECEMNK